MSKPSNARFISITGMAAVLSLLFMFFGGPLLRVVHNVFGAKKYWISGIVISAVLWLLNPMFALLLFSIWLCIGSYSELEAKGHAGFISGVFAVTLGTCVLMFGIQIWMSTVGADATVIFQESIANLLAKIKSTKSLESFNVEAKTLMSQMPSILGLMFMTTLGFALMLDRKFAMLAGLKFEKVASSVKLLEFRLPDYMIWVMMFSFLFSFLKLEQQMISIVALNVFNLTMGLYFFQGLAVLEVLFLVLRSGPIIKFLVYFFVVGQLFFLLSAVGVIDYWVDFRRRLKNKKLTTGSHNHGEQL